MRQIPITELPELVGQELGVSNWVAVDQERVDRFAQATGDHQWIHVDVERATAELGGTIAHGYLTLSLIPMLSQSMIAFVGVTRGINYGCNKVRFTNVVRVPAQVRLRQSVLACDKRAGGLQLVTECTVEIEGQTRPACVAETVAILYGERPARGG
ncbi:MAG: MaoC family dehydratase [Proteobacteria bacterium]|nr:MaoC family dehydratase [Pseudomonadota bacterium]